jgi:hypothetical protein
MTRSSKDTLKVQTEVATAVAGQLEVKLAGDEAAKIELGGTKNADAYDAYLHGLQLYEKAGMTRSTIIERHWPPSIRRSLSIRSSQWPMRGEPLRSITSTGIPTTQECVRA